MDVLTEVLDALRLKSTVYCRAELNSPWSLHFAQTNCATFHVIDTGSCWLKIDHEAKLIPLTAGDLIVLPQGTGHIISHEPGYEPIVTIKLDEAVPNACQKQRYDNGGGLTVLICGIFDFEYRHLHPLLSLLPDIIHIKGEQGRAVEWLSTTLHFLASEASSERPGADTILKRLADVLFIQVLRAWLEDPANQVTGWLGALRDPQVGQALSLIHRHPKEDWTVEKLAREVAMSRSAFAERFSKLVGASPIQYLTGWRMQVAGRLLKEKRGHLEEVALAIGYDSEAAFSKAFKREFGINPRAYRSQS